jgi:hypothetical protein
VIQLKSTPSELHSIVKLALSNTEALQKKVGAGFDGVTTTLYLVSGYGVANVTFVDDPDKSIYPACTRDPPPPPEGPVGPVGPAEPEGPAGPVAPNPPRDDGTNKGVLGFAKVMLGDMTLISPLIVGRVP